MSLEKILALNVNGYTEKKNGLTYLSWANAWQEFIKIYPQAKYQIIKNNNGGLEFGDEKKGYVVYTTVTVDDLTHEMWLPVMDHRNKSILQPTTFDINKAVMRCLTKNLAMFGLGLYIYAGEDLPETPAETVGQEKAEILSKLFADLVDKGKIKPTARKDTMAKYKVSKLADLTPDQYGHILQGLKKAEQKDV
jgi:hypothetical protein